MSKLHMTHVPYVLDVLQVARKMACDAKEWPTYYAIDYAIAVYLRHPDEGTIGRGWCAARVEEALTKTEEEAAA